MPTSSRTAAPQPQFAIASAAPALRAKPVLLFAAIKNSTTLLGAGRPILPPAFGLRGYFLPGLCVHDLSVIAWPKFQMATDGNTK